MVNALYNEFGGWRPSRLRYSNRVINREVICLKKCDCLCVCIIMLFKLIVKLCIHCVHLRLVISGGAFKSTKPIASSPGHEDIEFKILHFVAQVSLVFVYNAVGINKIVVCCVRIHSIL